VSGSVNPDKFVVDKVVMEINERTISTKHIECIYDHDKGEVVHADVEQDLQCKCCLDDQEIKELVRIAKIIEEHYSSPQDIELEPAQERVCYWEKERLPIIDGTGYETDQD
jgi:pyruvate,water dikinase